MPMGDETLLETESSGEKCREYCAYC
ncbi:hypothetical protein DWY99_03745 [[Clostridium] leptum]|uniref:Uncharacterized protein n=1 Tax=[Clostridium] leptum TaxID=1535 RepID=A0A412AZ18_9FIRM|nr:hypothetical protein DWY99_03745 [[Clostridium] leptum]